MRAALYSTVVAMISLAHVACWFQAPLFITAASAQTAASDDTRTVLERTKLQAEIDKLYAEVQDIKARQSLVGQMATFASVLTAIVTIIGSIVLSRLNYTIRSTQERKLEQEREVARDGHTLQLLRDLGHSNLPVRIASATFLFERLRQPRTVRHRTRERENLHGEQATVLQGLIAVVKDDKTDGRLAKFVGDELVKAVGARMPEEQKPAAPSLSPLDTFKGYKLDLQKVKFGDVLWESVDARGVDFFASDFTKASFKKAFLSNATFYEAILVDAKLQGADLRGSDLRGASLQGANFTGADLTGARLEGAKVDANTRWPEGFSM